MKTTRYALLAIADEETLGCRVWEGPWIPESVFAGYGTGNMTPALVRYKNESINRLVILFQKPIKNIVLPLKILRDKRNTAIRKQNVICHCTATTPKLSATFVLGQISALK